MDNGFEEWGGYMQAKINKLEEQFAQSSDFLRKSNLFAGISIYVNGLTNPSADELKRIMMVHGGTFHHYERSHTTYIIASNLPDVKIRNMNTSNIIKPDWVVDCLKENRILDYSKYLLYTNQKASQPKLQFKSNNASSTLTAAQTAVKGDSDVDSIMKDLKDLNNKIKGTRSVIEGSTASPEILEDEDLSLEPLGQCEDAARTNPSTRFAKSAVDPNFLSEFYNNSRLHHIATLGAGFKQYVSELREKHSGAFPLRQEVLKTVTKNEAIQVYPETIMHIDMDCFFVSVGLRSRPHLRGEPVAVTHSKGGDPLPRQGADRQKERELYLKKLEQKSNNYMKTEKIKSGFDGTVSLSEIASCSYEARKMGVRNGMFVGQAMKLCPNLKTIPYDFEEYREVAFTLYDTVAQYTLNIEAVSCDEMFVDLRDVLSDLQVETMDFVGHIRDEVKTKTGCPCSAGVGGNRLQARMATKRAKPDGQFFLNPENVEEYMANIPIADLPGVGYSTSYTLDQMKLKTCGDLQRIPMARLQQELGKKFGETLYQFCRGVDSRPLVYGQIRKSISAEVNYGIRFTEFDELEKFLRQLCCEVHSRLLSIKRRGKCITLKLMVRAKEAPVETSKFMGHGFCDNLTKSTTLAHYTSDLDVITKTILGTVKSLNIPPKELRGIGIHISKLDSPEDSKPKKENVLKAMFEKAVEKRKDSTVLEPVKIPLPSIQERNPITPIQPAIKKRKSSPTTPEKKPGKVGKRRGRPPKGTKTGNASTNILHTVAKRKSEDIPPDIDYSVLAELPVDMRDEILREHKRYAKVIAANKQDSAASSESNQNPLCKVDAEFLEALPLEIRSEIERDMARLQDPVPNTSKRIEENKSAATESSNIFDQPNCRQLIEAWIESTTEPEECDVDIFAQNAQELVQMRRISDLFVPLRLLHRIIGAESNCSWHAAYNTIANVVQREMIASFGSKMMLAENIACRNCSEF